MNKRYLSIWFPYLMSDQLARHNPQLQGEAYALVSKINQQQIIALPSRGARKMGLRKNIPLAEARILIPSLIILNYSVQEEQLLLMQLAQWFIRYSPHVALDPPDGLFLEIAGCCHLWGGEEAYLQAITQRMEQAGYFTRAAVADTPLLARAMAHYGQTQIVLPENKTESISTLPCKALRVDDTVLEKLDTLGFYKLDKLIAIAPAALRRRFGATLNEQLAQILGTKASYLQYIEERHLHQERLPCLEHIRTAKGIEIAIEKLLNLLCKRLQKENLGIRKLQLRGYRIDGKLQQICVSTSSPTLNQLHLFKLLELKICQIAPVLGIELFIIDALETETLLQQQEPIWHNSTQRIAELAPLLDRIGIRAGKNAIRQYHPQDRHWPEKSIKAVQNMTEPVLASSAKHKRRPCILLNRPELVQVSAPVPDYPPMNFVYQGKIHRIVKADGPERIEQEWWNSEGMHRDYYCVENEKGERYWLFRLGHYNEEVAAKWFVHGFFP